MAEKNRSTGDTIRKLKVLGQENGSDLSINTVQINKIKMTMNRKRYIRIILFRDVSQ
jgi:hypothetical protein